MPALSMRAAAAELHIRVSGVQFHFRTYDEFAFAVLKTWGKDVARHIERTAGSAARGLSRSWKLCEAWVGNTGTAAILIEALRGESEIVRAIAVDVVGTWIGLMRTSLHQAKHLKELKPEVDVRAAALHVHQALWSDAWMSALVADEPRARVILTSAWRCLAAVAADPQALLPPESAIAVPSLEVGPDVDLLRDPNPPNWKILLDPWNPLYQAFKRHAETGDPRNFLCAPEITPEDVAAAQALAPPEPETE